MLIVLYKYNITMQINYQNFKSLYPEQTEHYSKHIGKCVMTIEKYDMTTSVNKSVEL